MKEWVFLLETFLTLRGFDVVGKAYDGEEAIQVHQNLQVLPEIILMDFRMPRKDGILAMKEIQKINPYGKFIFLSADFSIKDHALEEGATLFLEKPINLEEIVTAIKQYVQV